MDEIDCLLCKLWDQRMTLPEPYKRYPRLRQICVVLIHPDDRRLLLANSEDYVEVKTNPEKVYGFCLVESLQATEGEPRLMLREDAEDLAAE